MKYNRTDMPREINDAFEAIKKGERELRRKKTKIFPSLSNLLENKTR